MSINKEQDFGTPASSSSQLVTLEIDGFQVTAPAGTSIMRQVSVLTSPSYVPPIVLSHLVPVVFALYRLKVAAECLLPVQHQYQKA